jgi:ribosomal protein S21
MSQDVTDIKDAKPSFEKRLREIQRTLQLDRVGKELKARIAYVKPSQKRTAKLAQRHATIMKAQRKKVNKSGRRGLLHIFDAVH